MLVRKKKENVHRKKAIPEGSGAEENLQSLRSWIQKIEQTTTSVSSRLSAVEKRLSGGKIEQNTNNSVGVEDPADTLFLPMKSKNRGEHACVCDGELNRLHTELVQQQQETNGLKEQLHGMGTVNTRIATELQVMKATISKMNADMEQRMKHSECNEPFVMHVGSVEIPVEFTGIIGGLLAFTIAVLVLIDQKEILLSPLFLVLVGVLLLGCALAKMVRCRTRSFVRPSFSMPVSTPATQVNPVPFERKKE